MKNHTRFTVRCTLAERAELEVKSGGNISEYARATLFEGQSQAMLDLQARVEELLQDQAVLRTLVRELAGEVRELRATPTTQPQPIAAPAQDNSRLEGMTLELLLLLRGRASNTERQQIHATVESEGLSVWESSRPPSSSMASNTTERRPQAAVEKQDSPAREDRSQGGLFKKWR
jgi:hypothetical protein